MINKPVVTTITTVHNGEKWLREAITSALNQEYENMQVAVFNDGSTDTTHEICLSTLNVNGLSNNRGFGSVGDVPTFYCFVDKPTGGPCKGRNMLIDWVKSNLYLNLDADDALYPNKVRKCVEKFIENPQLGGCYTDYETLDVHTGVRQINFGKSFHLGRLMQESIVHSQAMLSKHALDTVKENGQYYCEQLRCAEDWDLHLRIAEKFLFVHVPEVLALVRIHNNNATNSVNQETWNRCWRLVHERMQQRQ